MCDRKMKGFSFSSLSLFSFSTCGIVLPLIYTSAWSSRASLVYPSFSQRLVLRAAKSSSNCAGVRSLPPLPCACPTSCLPLPGFRLTHKYGGSPSSSNTKSSRSATSSRIDRPPLTALGIAWPRLDSDAREQSFKHDKIRCRNMLSVHGAWLSLLCSALGWR